jgi:hypothetical protein
VLLSVCDEADIWRTRSHQSLLVYRTDGAQALCGPILRSRGTHGPFRKQDYFRLGRRDVSRMSDNEFGVAS